MLITSPSPSVLCLELFFFFLFKLHRCGLAGVSHGISVAILCYLAPPIPLAPS